MLMFYIAVATFKAIFKVLKYTSNNTTLLTFGITLFFPASVKLVVQLRCECSGVAFIQYSITCMNLITQL